MASCTGSCCKPGLGCLPSLWLLGCAAVAVFAVCSALVPATVAKAKAPAKPSGKAPAPAPAVVTARVLLESSRVELTPNARDDLRSGRVDGCLVRLLAVLTARHSFAVSVLKTGHTKYVAGTRTVSNHYVWEGADIWKVDGHPVDRGNDAARQAAVWLLNIKGGCRPGEVGSPWDLDDVNPSSFTDHGHRDHLHIGI